MVKIPQGTRTLVFNQFLSLGDVLFLIPMARHYLEQGYQVLWPLDRTYADIQRHFPDIRFISRETCGIDLNRRDAFNSKLGYVLPLRWAEWVLKLPFKECMPAKYKLMGLPVEMWRKLTWRRNLEKEQQLRNYLGANGEYNLINHRFRADRTGWVPLKVNNGLRNIELTAIPGYTLLDWTGIIQSAATIHTVSTSILYMLEVLDLQATEVAIYTRYPDEKNLDFVRPIMSKNYKLYE